ncbi:hypothetical protein K5549_010935 [Capra hircus]|nr:hypothetical protein K5549_010935 [Capra hircus]
MFWRSPLAFLFRCSLWDTPTSACFLSLWGGGQPPRVKEPLLAPVECQHLVLAYMQLLEDYSEPQPSMFYQTPQKEHVYQQKNKLLMEVYGFSDAFGAGDAPHGLAPPPALPPKQRQLPPNHRGCGQALEAKRPVQPSSRGRVPREGSASELHLLLPSCWLVRSSQPERAAFIPCKGTLPWLIWETAEYARMCFTRTQPSAGNLRYRERHVTPDAKLAPRGKAEVRAQAAWLLLHTLKHGRSHRGVLGPSGSGGAGVHIQQTKVAFTPEDGSAAPGISVSVSNSFLSRHGSLPVPSSQSSDLAVPPVASLPPSTLDGPLSSQESSFHGNTVCLPSETSFTDSPQTPSSEHTCEGDYVSLYCSGQSSEELARPRGESPAAKDGHSRDATSAGCVPGKEGRDGGDRARKSPDALEAQSEEEVDELSLIDHNEIMARLTLKQEGDDGPDVRGGSGDILLVHATETDRKDLVLYCEAFLTTYRTFITPEELIKKLQYRYPRAPTSFTEPFTGGAVPSPALHGSLRKGSGVGRPSPHVPTPAREDGCFFNSGSKYEKFSPFADTFKKRVSKNTFFVLVRVVDELCLVELTEEILKLLMELVFRLVRSGELSLARVLRKNILDKVDQKKLLRCTNSDQPLAARGVAARPGTLHDFHSHEIAEQLTLLDAELFYKIEIPEVLLWAKEQNEEKSPNLTQFTEHFNNMSYWVRSIIMLQEKAQDRERLLLKFIKIMKHLRKLNNFNSYLAILSALDSAPIRRLEWQKQTSEGLAEYCTLIDSSSSFRAYRAALSEVEPPCIPYLGLILQDLTFVHLGNPDYIDGKVNFSKRWQQFNILDSMRCFQQAHYDIRRNDDIINFFNDFSDHLAEEALWELSLKIKPRNIARRKTDREEKT